MDLMMVASCGCCGGMVVDGGCWCGFDRLEVICGSGVVVAGEG